MGGRVVLEELAPDVYAGVDPIDDRIDDPSGTVNDVERWVKVMVGAGF